MKFQRPKGTEDLYGQQMVVFNNIIKQLTAVANCFNYQQIITPIIESSDLFLRAIGQTTNIVEKEIYQFLDKGQRSLALRPEGTAGVLRAIIENKLYSNQKQTLKYFYYGKMYRYEQPQKGRNREFHQFGVEVLATKSPYLDVDVMMLAHEMLQALSLTNVVLHLNYFGSETTKNKFNTALLTKLQQQQTKLCAECQKRIVKNPLRVLDCKHCHTLELDLPVIADYYQPEEQAYFQTILDTLAALKINFKIDQHLVRGLDYYNGVIFEFISTSHLLGKSQNTLIGGGRFDNLAQELGLPYPYPAVGFAFGLERIMLLLEHNPAYNVVPTLDLLIISQTQLALKTTLLLLNELRTTDYQVDASFACFNDKQKSSLIKNSTNLNHLLVLESEQTATLYQLLQQKKVALEYHNLHDLFATVMKYLKSEGTY